MRRPGVNPPKGSSLDTSRPSATRKRCFKVVESTFGYGLSHQLSRYCFYILSFPLSCLFVCRKQTDRTGQKTSTANSNPDVASTPSTSTGITDANRSKFSKRQFIRVRPIIDSDEEETSRRFDILTVIHFLSFEHYKFEF